MDINNILTETSSNLENLRTVSKQQKITIYDFFKSYRVIEFTIAAVVGISLTYIIRDLSLNVINPIIKNLLFKNNEYFTAFGVQFDIEKILTNIIFAVLSIIILYLIIVYFVKDIANKIIIENRALEASNLEYQLESIKLQEATIKLLRDIKNKLK